MNPFPVLAAIARALLAPADFERMALPALADAAFERPGSGPTLRWRAAVAWQLARVVLLSSAARWWDAAATTRWWILLCAALAGLAGCIGLQHGAQPFATRHALFLGIGLAAGAAVATLPGPWLRVVAVPAAALAAAALAMVPIAGPSIEGAQRWLQVGPLMIQVSTLALPLFAASVGWGARTARGWPAVLIAAATLAAVALQPDAVSTIVLAAVAVAACRQGRARTAMAVVAASACAVALWRWAPLSPVPHVEHAPRLLAHGSPVWFATALCMIGAVALWALRVWVRAARRGRDDAAPPTAGLLALLAVPWMMGDGGVPWLSFGGSAAVAAFVLTGMVLRVERQCETAAADR